MDLAEPRFVRAHGVLGLRTPLPPQQDVEEPFMAAVRSEFPNLAHRQPPIAGTPPNTPRLVLTSSSSQLVLSPGQADFEIRFYGDYPSDLSLCLDYIRRKMDTVRDGLSAIEQTPATVGLITSFQFSFEGASEHPATHILHTHLRTEVNPDLVQDAFARLAVRLRDKYFVNLTVSNFESRILHRPVMPGAVQAITVKPWEGSIDDFGVELTVDINNGLEGRLSQQDATITEQAVGAVLSLLEQVAVDVGPAFVEAGRIDVDQLVEELA